MDADRPAKRRWDAILAAVAVAVAVVYFVPRLVDGRPSGSPDVVTGTGGNTVATSAEASGPGARTTATADPAGPFAYTPARTWPEGAAGIARPAAEDISGFTPAEVEAAVDQVRSALIAARLDRRMIVDHDPSGFLDLLAPVIHDQVADRLQAADLTSLMLVTRIDSAAQLDRNPPRTSGRTSMVGISLPAGRALDIVTNYVWAYAFATGEVVIIHDEIRWRFYSALDVRADALGPQLPSYSGYVLGVDCAAARRGLLAPPTSVNRTSAAPTGENPGSYFAPDHGLDIATTCPNP